MSGLLRNLSAQALGRGTAVRSVARLPHAGPPAMAEPSFSEPTSAPPASAASVAASPDMTDRTARSQPGISHGMPPLLLPPRHHDASEAPLHPDAMRAPTDREIGVPARHPPAESAAPATATTPPALVPTTQHTAPPPAFVVPPLRTVAEPAGSHQPFVGGGETTEVHVSIGRIELTAVHEAQPPVRRAAPAKPSQSLHDYLGRHQRRPS